MSVTRYTVSPRVGWRASDNRIDNADIAQDVAEGIRIQTTRAFRGLQVIFDSEDEARQFMDSSMIQHTFGPLVKITFETVDAEKETHQ